jgi:surface polysaccharide O-acyltransferase-like enzyme
MNPVASCLNATTIPVQEVAGTGVRHFLWADLIRIWAIFAVVLLHCEAVPNSQFGQIPMEFWWQTNLYGSFVCTCVPLFIMLSGALILNQEQWDGARFLHRRVNKLLIPLVGWTLIYAAWYHFVWDKPLSLDDLLLHFVEGIAKPLFAHLWFLYLIISLYLMVPVLRIFFRHSSASQQLYFIVLWFVATGVKPLLAKLFGIDLGLYLDPFFGFVGYFMVGGTVARFLPERIGPRLLAVAGGVLVVGYAVNLIGTYLLSEQAGKLDDTLYEHTAPTVMMMTTATFVLLRHFSGRFHSHGAMLSGLSRLTFGIYLSHALVIVLLESGYLGFKLSATMLPPLFAAPALASAVLVLSALLTATLQGLPILRWLTPR